MKQRKLYNHILAAPQSVAQRKYAIESKQGAYGSYKNLSDEWVRDIQNKWPR